MHIRNVNHKNKLKHDAEGMMFLVKKITHRNVTRIGRAEIRIVRMTRFRTTRKRHEERKNSRNMMYKSMRKKKKKNNSFLIMASLNCLHLKEMSILL